MPVAGIAIIAGFVVIVILCVMADKNSNKKFLAKFQAEHQAKDTYGDLMVTTNGELIYTLGSGTLAGYKVWKLSDVSCIAFAEIPLKRKQFSVLDRNGKVSKGDYLTPSKKPLKEYAFKSFDVRNGQNTEEIIAFVRRNVGHIKFTVNSVDA